MAANFLMTLIGGISTILYEQTGGSGRRFKGLLLDYYPWELEPSGGVAATEGTADLYNLYRNPLEHALGLQTKEVGRGSSAQIHLKRIHMALGIAKQGLPEDLIEKLERSTTRPDYACATIIVGEGAKTLSVEGLYWGVREMIKRITSDNNRMNSAAKFLSGLSSS